MNAETTQEATALLQERGIFWWADEPLPTTQFAPESAVGGELHVTSEGRITLDLDGFLTQNNSRFAALGASDDPILKTKKIEGLLRESNKHVLLFDLSRRGGRFASSNVSFEGFMALFCLVGTSPFPKTKREITFSFLDVDLKGFEDWLRLGTIRVKRTKVGLRANYRHPKDIQYKLTDGKLSLKYDLSGPFWGQSRNSETRLKEIVRLRLTTKPKFTLSQAQTEFGILQDFLILMTDSSFNLDWPTVAVTNRKRYNLYFHRVTNTASAPRMHETLTNFLQVKENLGALFDAWRTKREVFGSGFYLYLGTRRGMDIYTEHQFIMLIWGLEAFHRRKSGSRKSTGITERVKRILGQISDSKDNKWSARQLKWAADPNLEQRLFETLKSLPLALDEDRVRRFASGCARDRNDLSHFGEQRDGGSAYSDFLVELHRKSEALGYLYHVLILYEIGLDEMILKWWVNESFYAFRIRSALAEVGLLEKPKPQAPEPGSIPITL
jgi:hypothetical protein